MQTCSTCKKELNEETAYKKTPTKWQSRCKDCFNKYCIDRWKKRKIKAIEYKGGKCECCSYDKFYGALEFHHLDPSEKDADWGKMRLWNWDKIKLELDKCICVCANCHREIHKDMVP